MIDFTDKNKQIELNIERLKEESERYLEIKSRIGMISIFYTFFAAYTIQLIKYALCSNKLGIFYIITLFLFLGLFASSVIFSILLLLPKEIAHKELPKIFYKDVYSNYKNNKNIKESDIKYYIRETYKEQIEKAVEHNYKLNNKKSKYHYYAFTLALSAIIPYLLCVGIKITKSPDDIQKIEITNSSFEIKNDTLLLNRKDNKMPTNEETNQQATNSEPVIDPSQVIHRDPEMIKENKEIPEPSRSTDTD
jgi:hypothetical protein